MAVAGPSLAPATLPGLRPAGRLPGGRWRAAPVEWSPRLRGFASRRGHPRGTQRGLAARCVPGGGRPAACLGVDGRV